MILIISSVFPPEPVVSASISYDISVELSKYHDVTVLTPKPTRPSGFDFKYDKTGNEKFRHIILGSFTCPESKLPGRMLESYSFGKHASRYIRKNVNIIKCIYANVWPLFAQYEIVKTAKKYSLPVIIHVQDIYPESLVNRIPIFEKIIMKLLLPMDKFILRNSARVVVVSENMLRSVVHSRGVDETKAELIFNWQDENEFLLRERDQIRETKKSTFTFMYLGNIGNIAGVDLLIKSFFDAGLTDTKLIISGSGSKKGECVQLSKSLGIPNIEFLNVPAGMVPSIQKKADILLLPVKKNAALSSVPSKLISYMFSGKPVIACVDEYSDTAETIRNAGCGWVISPENRNELSETMIRAKNTNDRILKRMGQNGYEYALKNFSKKVNLRKLSSVILSVTSQKFQEAYSVIN